ncbi:unnamed protein product [Cuscuta epithymum]|uniref:DUF3615 domain-containing protein n=1 Tax=Cuscuta epithymum TaxID=186058 RepID=A0AAV0FXY9_9ASTE|nr:unnamed protein product [Cuscuta epithymum]CAH9140093.1 unnamed protein product [Cuscuta epithymum]
MVSSDGGDYRSNAKKEKQKKLKKLKDLEREKSHRKRSKKHGLIHRSGGKAPPVQLSYTHSVVLDEWSSLRAAQTALSDFNERRQFDEQGPHEEYELVQALGCAYTMSPDAVYPSCLHFNFIARPKNKKSESLVVEEDNKLFFGEVKCSYINGSDSRCSFCCILGQPGTVTGLCGCDLHCRYCPELIQHPEGGGYRMSYKPVVRLMMGEESENSE